MSKIFSGTIYEFVFTMLSTPSNFAQFLLIVAQIWRV